MNSPPLPPRLPPPPPECEMPLFLLQEFKDLAPRIDCLDLKGKPLCRHRRIFSLLWAVVVFRSVAPALAGAVVPAGALAGRSRRAPESQREQEKSTPEVFLCQEFSTAWPRSSRTAAAELQRPLVPPRPPKQLVGAEPEQVCWNTFPSDVWKLLAHWEYWEGVPVRSVSCKRLREWWFLRGICGAAGRRGRRSPSFPQADILPGFLPTAGRRLFSGLLPFQKSCFSRAALGAAAQSQPGRPAARAAA